MLAGITNLPEAGAVWKANADLPYQIVSDDIFIPPQKHGDMQMCVMSIGKDGGDGSAQDPVKKP